MRKYLSLFSLFASAITVLAETAPVQAVPPGLIQQGATQGLPPALQAQAPVSAPVAAPVPAAVPVPAYQPPPQVSSSAKGSTANVDAEIDDALKIRDPFQKPEKLRTKI